MQKKHTQARKKATAATKLEAPMTPPVQVHQTSLRAEVAYLRSLHRTQHAEMAERTRVQRASFVQQIHTDVTQRIMPEVAELRAGFRAEHAEMAEQTRLARQQVVNQIRAWVG